MCGCENNVVDLQQLKIYTIMAEYKAKLSSGTTYKDGVKIKWAIATQEELAHAYEVLGLTTHVEKIEKTKTRKSDVKKVSKVKEETNDSEKESGKDKENQE
jgi:hypothetical protein